MVLLSEALLKSIPMDAQEYVTIESNGFLYYWTSDWKHLFN